MTKQLEITLVAPGSPKRSAVVTLSERCGWTASAVVDLGVKRVEHASIGHVDERNALVAIAGLLRRTLGGSTAGSTVTIVGVEHQARAVGRS